MKKSKQSLILVLIIVMICLTACKKNGNEQTGPAQVKIGVLLDFSGAKAAESEQMLAMMQMAVDEINAAGGVLTEKIPVTLVKKDDMGDPMQSVAGYYQLVEEGVCAIIGTNNELGMEHIITASSNSNVPIITPSVANDTIVAGSNFCFQSCISDAYTMKAFAQLAKDELNLEKVAVIYAPSPEVTVNKPTNHKDRTIALYEDFASAMLDKQIEISYACELTSVSPEELFLAFDKVVESGAQAVFVPVPADELESVVLPIAKGRGYNGVFFGTMDMASVEDTKDYKLYIPTGFCADNEKKYVSEFGNRLAKYIGEATIITDVRSAYEAVYILRDAIESGYLATSVSIALKLPFLEGSLLLGEYEMGAYGNITRSIDFVRLINNTTTYVATVFE